MKNSRKSAGRTVVGAFALATVLLATAAPASAADSYLASGTYNGNACSAVKHRTTSNPSAQGCVAVFHETGTNVMQYQIRSVDLMKDGASSYTTAYISQYIPGTGWKKGSTFNLINSEGVGTSRVAKLATLIKAPGATKFQVNVAACTKDLSAGTVSICVFWDPYPSVTW